MLRTAPGTGYLAFAEEHLSYEANMFVEASNMLANVRTPFEMNMRVEVLALHLRNLLHFFYPGKTWGSDVLAIDYVPYWNDLRLTQTPALIRARERANEEIAHLTGMRIAGVPREKEWNFVELRRDLREVVAVFLQNADARLGPNATLALKRI